MIARTQLSDFIKVYDGTLTPGRCRDFIERFEASPQLHERKEMADSYHFTQMSVGRHWPDVLPEISSIMMKGLVQYHHALQVGPRWPTHPLNEELRLKRYLPDGRDGFEPHVDVMDQSTSYRFVTAILYLNAPEGGETLFPDLGMRVPPQAGRMVIFPPLWLFPHAGLPPRNQPKYILHTYLWYPPEDEKRYPV